jgi:hypothetical protein
VVPRIIFFVFVFWPAIVGITWKVSSRTKHRLRRNKVRKAWQKQTANAEEEWAAMGFIEVAPGQYGRAVDQGYRRRG